MQEKIDLEKINESYDAMSSIENVIHHNDVMSHFEDVERILDEVNFYHGDSIPFHDDLENIYDDFLDVSFKIHELVDSIKMIRDIHMGLSSSQNGFLFLRPDEIRQVQAKVVENGFNAVPIAVAIGATAAVGSVGAIVVDGIYRVHEKDDKYQSSSSEVREKYVPPFHESDYSNVIEELEEMQPIGDEIEVLEDVDTHESYHATSSDMGKYYNDERGFHLENDDTDDVFYDDFYE